MEAFYQEQRTHIPKISTPFKAVPRPIASSVDYVEPIPVAKIHNDYKGPFGRYTDGIDWETKLKHGWEMYRSCVVEQEKKYPNGIPWIKPKLDTWQDRLRYRFRMFLIRKGLI